MATITITTKKKSQLDLFIALAKEMKIKYTSNSDRPKNEIEKADEDIRLGRVYKAESVDDMFNQILGEGNW
ncbi:MAG: hypothetical protein IK013_07780 [Bacteroidales bacterium]|nr:hypothetical protein [Bacteroidales bacterium]